MERTAGGQADQQNVRRKIPNHLRRLLVTGGFADDFQPRPGLKQTAKPVAENVLFVRDYDSYELRPGHGVLRMPERFGYGWAGKAAFPSFADSRIAVSVKQRATPASDTGGGSNRRAYG